MVSTKLFYVRCLRERALKLGLRARKDRSDTFAIVSAMLAKIMSHVV